MVVQENLCSNQSVLQCESHKAIPRIDKKLRKKLCHKKHCVVNKQDILNQCILYGQNGTLTALEYFGLLSYKKDYCTFYCFLP